MNWSTFSHEAMATTFQIALAGEASDYLRQAAAAAFRELDRLEGELSRFVETSDIARANRLAEGESVNVGESAVQCLVISAEISELTGRAFDPAYASERPSGSPADAALFLLDPSGHTLTSLASRLHLDLGAVGKGHALDCMAEVLREWDLSSACLQSGGSTVLALTPPPAAAGWPVGLGPATIALTHRALSGSGIAVQGSHLINPHTRQPAARTARVWSFAPTAAVADALSTAFFVMSDEAVEAFCRAHPEFGAVLTQPDGTLRKLGNAV